MIATAMPRRWTPRASSHSTAGLRAKARKIATKIQIRTPCAAWTTWISTMRREDDPEHDQDGARAEADEALLGIRREDRQRSRTALHRA